MQEFRVKLRVGAHRAQERQLGRSKGPCNKLMAYLMPILTRLTKHCRLMFAIALCQLLLEAD